MLNKYYDIEGHEIWMTEDQYGKYRQSILRSWEICKPKLSDNIDIKTLITGTAGEINYSIDVKENTDQEKSDPHKEQ